MIKKNILFILLGSLFLMGLETMAREKLDFKLGDEIQVLADKSFGHTQEKKFEAVGNVIITHEENALYGESAIIDFKSHKITVKGNVRYVTKDLVIYGSSMTYNFKTTEFSIENARVHSESFNLVGEKITKLKDNTILATNAEYSTCKDCPESWSIFGYDVKITEGEYIRIKNGLFKVKGMTVMYVPYILFPIKKNRETGILFPQFFPFGDDGFKIQQPFFWAITPSMDMTLTPSSWGERGVGSEIEFRHVIGDKKWYEIYSLGVYDKKYRPNTRLESEISDHYFRYYLDYEHHFQFSQFVTHHLQVSEVRDLDIFNNYRKNLENRLVDNELGLKSFLDFRLPVLAFNVGSYFGKNIFFGDPLEFDHHYVQMLPRLSLSFVPISLINTNIWGLYNIRVGLDSDFTVFRQNHFKEGPFLRNVNRLGVHPYVNWYIGRIGPVHFDTSLKLDHQYYTFKRERHQDFYKRSSIIESQVSIELNKIFGLAYEKEVPVEIPKLSKDSDESNPKKDEKKILKEGSLFKNTIGKLGPFHEQYSEESVTLKKNSYRHTQFFALKHRLIGSESLEGNSAFREQIQEQAGIFDYEDLSKIEETGVGHTFSRKKISSNNSIEFIWNHTFIKKSPLAFDFYNDYRYLRNNFSYEKLAFLNISQGFNLTQQRRNVNVEDWVERLHLESGISLKKWNLSFDEYYFYDSKSHITNVTVGRTFDYGKISASFEHNSFIQPRLTLSSIKTKFSPISLIELSFDMEYDIKEEEIIKAKYGVSYIPSNNCWKIDFNYEETIVDDIFYFSFYFNFGNNTYSSLGQG